jgi:hypothetical protein
VAITEGGAQRTERIEVGIEPPASDHVSAGRRHPHAPEARQQRSGEQERRPDPLGQLLVDHAVLGDVRSVDRDLALTGPAHACAEALEQQHHRLDVADPGDVPQRHLVLGQQAGREDRKRAVLVSGRDDRACKRRPALDHEFLHVGSQTSSCASHLRLADRPGAARSEGRTGRRGALS